MRSVREDGGAEVRRIEEDIDGANDNILVDISLGATLGDPVVGVPTGTVVNARGVWEDEEVEMRSVREDGGAEVRCIEEDIDGANDDILVDISLGATLGDPVVGVPTGTVVNARGGVGMSACSP